MIWWWHRRCFKMYKILRKNPWKNNRKKWKKVIIKCLTQIGLCDNLIKHVWRDIEVVITRRSWKPFVRKGARVRIPLSPLTGNHKSSVQIITYRNWDLQFWAVCRWNWRSTQEAQGTPLERVQVVNSGARVQIPPSPFNVHLKKVCIIWS